MPMEGYSTSYLEMIGSKAEVCAVHSYPTIREEPIWMSMVDSASYSRFQCLLRLIFILATFVVADNQSLWSVFFEKSDGQITQKFATIRGYAMRFLDPSRSPVFHMLIDEQLFQFAIVLDRIVKAVYSNWTQITFFGL